MRSRLTATNLEVKGVSDRVGDSKTATYVKMITNIFPTRTIAWAVEELYKNAIISLAVTSKKEPFVRIWSQVDHLPPNAWADCLWRLSQEINGGIIHSRSGCDLGKISLRASGSVRKHR